MARQPYLTLVRLIDLTPEEVKTEWARRYGAPAPNLSQDLLRLGISYKLQEQRLGSISRSTRSLLRRVAERTAEGASKIPLARKLTPGTRLVRDWHGVGHTVTVLDKGFEYGGRHWTSLTAIAGAITDSKWNGPRFFGLPARST